MVIWGACGSGAAARTPIPYIFEITSIQWDSIGKIFTMNYTNPLPEYDAWDPDLERCKASVLAVVIKLCPPASQNVFIFCK